MIETRQSIILSKWQYIQHIWPYPITLKCLDNSLHYLLRFVSKSGHFLYGTKLGTSRKKVVKY